MFEIGLFVVAWAVWARWVHRRAKGVSAANEVQRHRHRQDDRKDELSFRSKYRHRRTRPSRTRNPRKQRQRPWQPKADAAPTRAAQETKSAGAPDLYFGW